MTTPAPKPRKWTWPAVIFTMLGCNMCIVAVTVYAAHRQSSSMAIEPDYDRKALHWEDAARQIRASAALGWKVNIDSTKGHRLEISITDSHGLPVEASIVKVEAFHHAHARDRVLVTLSSTSPGHYSAPAAIDESGLWEFQFFAARGVDTFTQSLTRAVYSEPTR